MFVSVSSPCLIPSNSLPLCVLLPSLQSTLESAAALNLSLWPLSSSSTPLSTSPELHFHLSLFSLPFSLHPSRPLLFPRHCGSADKWSLTRKATDRNHFDRSWSGGHRTLKHTHTHNNPNSPPHRDQTYQSCTVAAMATIMINTQWNLQLV